MADDQGKRSFGQELLQKLFGTYQPRQEDPIRTHFWKDVGKKTVGAYQPRQEDPTRTHFWKDVGKKTVGAYQPRRSAEQPKPPAEEKPESKPLPRGRGQTS